MGGLTRNLAGLLGRKTKMQGREMGGDKILSPEKYGKTYVQSWWYKSIYQKETQRFS